MAPDGAERTKGYQATVERVAAALAEAGDDARAAGLRRHVAVHAVEMAEAYGLLEATVDRLSRSRGAARAVDDASRRLLMVVRAFLRLAVALELRRARIRRRGRRRKVRILPAAGPTWALSGATGARTRALADALIECPESGRLTITAILDRLLVLLAAMVHAVAWTKVERPGTNSAPLALVAGSCRRIAVLSAAVRRARRNLDVGKSGYQGKTSQRHDSGIWAMDYGGIRDLRPRVRAAEVGRGMAKPALGAVVSKTLTVGERRGGWRHVTVTLGVDAGGFGMRWHFRCPACDRACRHLYEAEAEARLVCGYCSGTTWFSQKYAKRPWYLHAINSPRRQPPSATPP